MSTPAGMTLRRHGGVWVGILRCGAGSADEARAMADGYLSRRRIAGVWTKTTYRGPMKVGIAGLRRFDVYYELAMRP